jgi:glycosyltransferase involved in cell wall biosynthesis
MKICHVNLASGYHGGENQTLALIQQQLAMGYQLTVVANPKSPFAKAVDALNCQLVLAKNFFQAHRASVTADCQLVHVHEGRAIYWALLQKQLYKIPYIVTRRIDNPLSKKWSTNLAYENAAAVIGLSREIVQRIRAAYPQCMLHQIPSSPIRYPVDSEQVLAIKKQFGQKFIVIHAAHMLKHKGFDVSIAAARLLQNHHPHIHFVLLGDGVERAALEKTAADLHNLTFMGKQNNMGTWFKAADLQIHPSYTEGLGSVILEGLHSGLPVIASNAGGIPDIIDHEISGLLIEPGNAQALANAIIRLHQDADLRQRLLVGATEKLKAFLIEHTALRYQHIYQQVGRGPTT